MKGFVELTQVNQNQKKALLNAIKIDGIAEDDEYTKIFIGGGECPFFVKESYGEVKALIEAAQEPEPENKKLFIPVTHISGAPVLIEVSRVGVVDGYGENGTARIFDSQGDGLKDRWLVRESVEEVHRLIKEAQEG